jgi:hypothetical protein
VTISISTMEILNDGFGKKPIDDVDPITLIRLLGIAAGVAFGLCVLSEGAGAATIESPAASTEFNDPMVTSKGGAPSGAVRQLGRSPGVDWDNAIAHALASPPAQSSSSRVAIASPSSADGLLLVTDKRSRKPLLATHARPSTDTVVSQFLDAASTTVPQSPAISASVEPAAIATSTDLAEADETEATGTEADGMAADGMAADGTETAATETPGPIADYQPLLQFQAASLWQEDELSGRLRASALYALNEQVMFGATVDLVGGEAFVDSEDEGLSLNELYVAAAPFQDTPNLRFVGGLIDLTSYFDRNSFAKDVVTHFFHPVFQTNPALSSAGMGSRPGLLVNWSATDQLELKAAAFSSDRDLGDWALDGFAAEAGYRSGNFIVRGTFATARDAGDDTGFTEIFQIQRGDGSFGPREDDREIAYGLNAEYFIDSINVGLFGRFGWYENQDLDRSGTTFSLGANALDLFLEGDRLGLGYGRQLSNDDLRASKTPDVWEVFYDVPVYSHVRAGISLQSRDEFSDTSLGLRVRADW